MRTASVVRMSASVADNLMCVLEKIRVTYEKTSPETRSKNLPNLIAVSKTKPKENIIEAYNAGQRHFGENYVQELLEKSTELESTCPEISWHFIGSLQSKNVSKLLKVRNLSVLHTLSSRSLADKLQNATQARDIPSLSVLVQVNVSGEANKGGVAFGPEVSALVSYILSSCPRLHFLGLMAIGAPGEEKADFSRMRDLRRDVAQEHGINEESLRLSIGMSGDMETAVEYGSTDLRMGRQIFGERTPKA
uniref:Pyridoxal phosphate homeostasis protein n=1 Tax=Caligus clemensi TaxID=344056 RepID=C1C1P8_CALCM|nr:Proline synthetase co-transcribed bacterial homolog protein [Caligus clemensi]